MFVGGQMSFPVRQLTGETFNQKFYSSSSLAWIYIRVPKDPELMGNNVLSGIGL